LFTYFPKKLYNPALPFTVLIKSNLKLILLKLRLINYAYNSGCTIQKKTQINKEECKEPKGATHAMKDDQN